MLCKSSMLGYVTNRQPICNIFNFYWTPPHVTLEATRSPRTEDRLFMGQTNAASRFVSDPYPGRKAVLLFMGLGGVTCKRRKEGRGRQVRRGGAGRIFPGGRKIVPLRSTVGPTPREARRNPCHPNSLSSASLGSCRSVCVSSWHGNCPDSLRQATSCEPVWQTWDRGSIVCFFVERKSDEFGIDGFIGK